MNSKYKVLLWNIVDDYDLDDELSGFMLCLATSLAALGGLYLGGLHLRRSPTMV